MKLVYDREKIVFYSKAMPVITITIGLLTLAIELMIHVFKISKLNWITEVVNGVMCLIFIIFTFLTRRYSISTWFICPLLTSYIFYYLAFVDYDATDTSIFYILCIGITVSFFLLVVFNEVWLMSTGVYAPFFVYFMWKTGKDMLGTDNNTELIVRSLFCIFIYGLVSYRIEQLNKQAFLGRETADKAFYRWLKIFETFPEGIALIRNGQIIYANKSFVKHFEFTDYDSDSDPFNDHLKKLLTITNLDKLGADKGKVITVWDFITGSENGAPFSLKLSENA